MTQDNHGVPMYVTYPDKVLHDTSPVLEAAVRKVSLLLFISVVDFLQKNSYGQCRIELYASGYIRLVPKTGWELEAFHEDEDYTFRFVSEIKEGPFGVHYSGRIIRNNGRRAFPIKPSGVLYFQNLDSAKNFFDRLAMQAYLFACGAAGERLLEKKEALPVT